MPRFELDVAFKCENATVVVEADSLADAWERRFELAADVDPPGWEVHPLGVVPVRGGSDG